MVIKKYFFISECFYYEIFLARKILSLWQEKGALKAPYCTLSFSVNRLFNLYLIDNIKARNGAGSCIFWQHTAI